MMIDRQARAPRRIPHGKLTTAVILLGAACTFGLTRPDLAARSATGLTAHSLCSARFVSGQGADVTFEKLVAPLVGPVAPLISYEVDAENPSVTARFAAMFPIRASFTQGFGCRIDSATNTPQRAIPASARHTDPSAPLAVAMDPALTPAIDRIFEEQDTALPKHVIAVVVLRDGRIIAERYAQGYDAATPLLGFSVSKSIINALTGILVRQGRLRLDQTGVAPEWRDAGDPRSRITVEDLLRMTSGLDAEEAGSSSDPVTRMLYAETDMAAFVARRPQKLRPGASWEYTSANTLILSRLIGSTVGGGPVGLRAFARRELFDPLGMQDVTMEFDGVGTFIGSSYLYAPARSFARFGKLYLDDGVLPDGRRVLPTGWATWSRRSTLGLGYGAGFWTNDGGGKLAASRISGGFPKEGFFASGNLGQRIYIIPSARLVVARFGYSSPPDFGIEDDIALIARAIRSERDTNSAGVIARINGSARLNTVGQHEK